MFSLNDKISIRQLQILIILDSFGTGIITLPRIASEAAGVDGWISVIVSVLIAAAGVYIMTTLGRMFPNQSFYSYSSAIASKPVGFVLSILLVAKLILLISFELYFFGEIVNLIMLKNTPRRVIILTLLLISGYACGKGYETRARIAELLIFVIIIPLLLVFSFASLDVDFSNILPVLKTPPKDILYGGFECFQAFMGLEALLLVYPYMNNQHKVRRSSVNAVIIVGIIFVIITFITMCRFGTHTILDQPWPILEMMDTVDLPGSFIERQEAFIMSFWIVSMFAIVNAGLFFSAIVSKSIIKKGTHAHYVIFFMVAVFLIIEVMDKMPNIYDTMNFIHLRSGIAFVFVIPLILIIIAKVRGLGHEKA